MQKKYETYEQLFTNTIGGLTENSEKWLGFLETASRMYKYSFEDQLLIYAQRPETRACADFSFWTAVNRMNRQLRQGCNEIALLNQEKKKLHYVYAMEDTEPRTNGKSRNPEHYIWQLAPGNRDVINDMLCRQGGINSNNIEKTIISMTSSMTKLKIAEYISEFDNLYHGLGIKSPKSELETAVAEIAAASAAYMTAKRTGTDVSDYLNMDCFSKLSLIDNPELTAFLGRVTTDTAGAVLKLIERNVNEYKIQERSSANELTKGENRERNTLRSERGNNDISPDISRGQRGGHTDNISLRQDEREVSQGELQSNIQQDADVRRVSSSSGVDRRTSSDNGRTDNIGNGESGRNRRGAESERPDEVGRSDEQLQTGSSRDNSQGTDRSILSKEAEETKPSASSSAQEKALHNAFDELNLNHSFSAEQKLFFERIEQFATKNNITENIIDRAFSERPVYRRTYGNRDKLSQNLFNHSLKVLESELERVIRKNLAESNEKSAVSVEQETSEAMNVHSEKTEGQEKTVLNQENQNIVEEQLTFDIDTAQPKQEQAELIQDNTTKTDFTITDDKLGEGGAKTKYRANVEAIKTLKTIESEERAATPEEQEILSKYVGWGGLKNAFEDFHDDWKKEFTELKELLTPEEYKLAKASVLNAHYTSPLVIEKMYEALRNNGFTGGKILEPAMGIGNYFGKMPEDICSSSNLYGVELDDISGRIAKQLYQNANIRITGFEKTSFKDNSFDLAIGNVPFGAYSINEPKYNKYHFQIHDHFFAKALDKVKPGGIVAFITSKGTLDKKNPDVRKYIAERAELVGAIRLPNNAFKNNAGTEVTSDIIFLQKRENPIELTPLSTPDWVHLGKTDKGLPVNQYFIDNPQMVLGNIVAGNKLYGHGNDDTMCEAIEGADLSEQLSEAIKHINFEVLEKREEMAVEDANAEIPSGIKNFSYAVINDKIYYRNNDEMELFNGKKSDIPRIKAMVDIRDTLRELIACQLDNGSDEQLHELQTKLNTVYDSFVAKYGRINDKINTAAFKEDSSAPLLSSLEIYKGEEFSEKAAIFEKRTILAKNDVSSADTSSEALTLSLAKKACVDMAYMQELTGFSEEKILSELKGVVFENPIKMDENGKPRLEASDEYLSGNIRTKLEYMKAFHTDDNRYTHNIAALEAAMPTRIEAADIDVKLGSPCVKPEIIQQFMYETFNTPRYKQDFGLGYKDSVTVQYAEINSTWFIPNKSSEKNNTAANSKFGTQRCSAYELLEDCLNMKNTVVKDAIERDGKRVYVLNQTETEFAQEKQRQLQETFKNWIFADPVRREDVVETYNRMFNSIRPREYDGSVLEFPGMNNEIQLRKHQRDAVAHALYGGNTLFAHEVGAGKTFEMIAAAMEGKRLGLHHKAMICVSNHLTEQIGADFIKLYPNANVLVATSKDFTKNNRRKLFGKIATGDYDGIIIGHSQLVNLPVSKERQQNLMKREIDEIVTSIATLKSQNGQDYQIKQLERTRKSLETKLEKLIEAPRRDDVVDFEELGIDKLILDEAHEFKNLFISTKMGNISGISTNDDVQKTFDLYLKCQYLDEITNNKGLIFATGTPYASPYQH